MNDDLTSRRTAITLHLQGHSEKEIILSAQMLELAAKIVHHYHEQKSKLSSVTSPPSSEIKMKGAQNIKWSLHQILKHSYPTSHSAKNDL